MLNWRMLQIDHRQAIVLSCWLSLTSLSMAPVAVAQAPAPAVSYSSVNELNQMLGNLQQASQSTLADLGHLRIDKWKTDSGTKRQTEADVESIQKNLQNALPGILNELKASPENVAQTFKMYRNLDALFDVMTSVAESTGAFGSKDEFQSLNRDLGAIQDSRHSFADRMDRIALAKETELGQLRTALQTARAEATPKKTVVDDTAPPPKKPVTRKKPAPKPPTPSSQTPPPSSTSPQQH
jgi:hypothetical protein